MANCARMCAFMTDSSFRYFSLSTFIFNYGMIFGYLFIKKKSEFQLLGKMSHLLANYLKSNNGIEMLKLKDLLSIGSVKI